MVEYSRRANDFANEIFNIFVTNWRLIIPQHCCRYIQVFISDDQFASCLLIKKNLYEIINNLKKMF